MQTVAFKEKITDIERYIERLLPVQTHMQISQHLSHLLLTNASP